MKKVAGLILSSFLILTLVITGCASKETGADHASDDVVVVGTDAQFPPFEKQEGDGSITGFDADVLAAVAKAGGFKADLQHTGWDPMFDGIDRGKLDAGIAAIAINDERKQKYDFTDSYFEATQVILVPADSAIQSLSELKGKNIGVQSATTGEMVVQDAFGKTYQGIKGFDDLPSAVEDLKLGRLDAVVADNAVVMEYVKKLGSDKFKIVEDPSIAKEQYGIIVKKGNKELLDKLNAGLKKIREDGTYDKIYEKYFGTKN